jgi:hypothetical protein
MSGESHASIHRERLQAVLGVAVPRYLSVAEAGRVSGLSCGAVYRAINRGDLAAGLVCSRLRIHPDDFLAWMEGDRVARGERPRTLPRVGSRRVPAPNGLRTLLQDRSSAA